MTRPPRVFISYSHDSDEHMDRVLALANRLRADGVDSSLDQYEVAPPEGWPEWCRRQIHKADFVVIACTQTYRDRVEGNETTGDGLGAKWEGMIITQAIYDQEGKNRKFIPVVFSWNEVETRPELLRGVTHYVLDNPQGYFALYRHLTDQPAITKPDLGKLIAMPVKERREVFREEAPAGPPGTDRVVLAIGPRSDVPSGTAFLGRNDKGFEEYRWLKDDSVMIRIPGGEFWMGSPAGEGDDDERPQHCVDLREFYIDKYPVTNKQFARFVREAKYRTEAEQGKVGRSFVWDKRSGSVECERISWRDYYGPKTEDHPVVLVSWNDAQEYCTWAGKRLPTEAEWEKAARGTDGRKHPWGDREPDDALANFGSKRASTTPVGSFPKGCSPFGGLDMAGNVWEWCSDLFGENYYGRSPDRNPQGASSGSFRVYRGGGWYCIAGPLRCAYRYWGEPAYRGGGLGFRCAHSGNS